MPVLLEDAALSHAERESLAYLIDRGPLDEAAAHDLVHWCRLALLEDARIGMFDDGSDCRRSGREHVLADDEPQRLVAAQAAAVGGCDGAQLETLVQGIAGALGTPTALATLVTAGNVVVLASVGLEAEDSGPWPREVSFCTFTVHRRELLVIDDVHADEAFHDHPSAHCTRAYAGAPILTADGLAIGAVCVGDCRARSFSASERMALVTAAREAASLLTR